jgi:DNA-binding CsgD family transcriptional regulator
MPPAPLASPAGRPAVIANVALGHAAAAIGTDRFYPTLLDAFRALVRHDVATAVRYSAVAKPVFLFHHGFSDELARLYETIFFAFDPFQAYWSETERPGVVSLAAVSPQAMKRGRYVREFLQASRIEDELGLFLPPVGRASVALFLERSAGRFTRREHAVVEDHRPLLAGLSQAHARLGGEAGSRAGVTQAGDAGPDPLLDGFGAVLTPRERDIVGLILEGFPTATIARRLKVAPGTVKNHRLRIYDKLDITSERELFLAYLQKLRASAPS